MHLTSFRVEFSPFQKHKDLIADKGFTSKICCNLLHLFITLSQAMKIPYAKAAADKEWKTLDRDDSSMTTGESQEQEGGYSRSTKGKKKVHFVTLMVMSSPECGVGTRITEVQRQSFAP